MIHFITSSKGSTGKTLLSTLLFLCFYNNDEESKQLIGMDINFMNLDFSHLVQIDEKKSLKIHKAKSNSGFFEVYQQRIFTNRSCMVCPDLDYFYFLPSSLLNLWNAINSIIYNTLGDSIPRKISKKTFNALLPLSIDNYYAFDVSEEKAFLNENINTNFKRRKVAELLYNCAIMDCNIVIDTNLHVGSIFALKNTQQSNVLIETINSDIWTWFIWHENTISKKYEKYINQADRNINRLLEKRRKFKAEHQLRTLKDIEFRVIHVIYTSMFYDKENKKLKLLFPAGNNIFFGGNEGDLSLTDVFKQISDIFDSVKTIDFSTSGLNRKNVLIINDIGEDLDREKKSFINIIRNPHFKSWNTIAEKLPSLTSNMMKALKGII